MFHATVNEFRKFHKSHETEIGGMVHYYGESDYIPCKCLTCDVEVMAEHTRTICDCAEYGEHIRLECPGCGARGSTKNISHIGARTVFGINCGCRDLPIHICE